MPSYSCKENSERNICEVISFWSEVKWSEGKWVTLKFLGTKVQCTLGWPCTAGTWLYCDYFIWCVSCTLVVSTCFVICVCGCFDNYVGVLVISVLVFTVFLYCFVYVYLFSFVTSVRNTATELNSIAVNKNKNNKNIKFLELPNKKHAS